MDVGVILSGCAAMKLSKETASKPLGMVDFAGRPFLSYILDKLEAEGVVKVFICTHHEAQTVEAYVRSEKRPGLRIELFREDELSGTGGVLKKLESRLEDRFVVCGGNSLIRCSLSEVLAFHEKHSAPGTVVLSEEKECLPEFGIGKVEKDGRISEYYEKPANPFSSLANTIWYVFDHRILERFPPRVMFDLSRDLLTSQVRQNRDLVRGYVSTEGWVYFGSPTTLSLARNRMARWFGHRL